MAMMALTCGISFIVLFIYDYFLNAECGLCSVVHPRIRNLYPKIAPTRSPTTKISSSARHSSFIAGNHVGSCLPPEPQQVNY